MFRRVHAADWLLIGTLIPVWAFGLGLHLRAGFTNQCASLPFAASSAPRDGHPRIGIVRGDVGAGLAPGDRVIRVGSHDLRGVTAAGFLARAFAVARTEPALPLEIERDGRRFELRVSTVPAPLNWWSTIPFSVGLAGTALLLLLRAPGWPLRRRFFVAALLNCISAAFYRSLGGPFTLAWVVANGVSFPLAAGLTLWNQFEWAEAARPARPWQRILALCFAIGFAVLAIWAGFLPVPVPGLVVHLTDPLFVAYVSALLFAGVWTWRRSSPLELRQTKWIFFGLYVGCLPFAVALLAGLVGAPVEWQTRLLFVGRLSLVAIPLGFLIAILGYGYLDIDRLISATASYNALAVVGVGVGAVALPRAAAAASGLLGLEGSASELALSLLLAALVVPAHRRLRPAIERFFFAERHALDLGVRQLLRDLSAAEKPESLLELLGARASDLLRPEACVIYAQTGTVYAPLFVQGRAVPPALDAAGPLVATLRGRLDPLAFGEAGRRRRTPDVSPFERATLETLDAAVVAPIRRGDLLFAVLCLGRKRSGDVYTLADLRLLESVLHRVSTELLRFDQQAVLRESRAMQEALRRYVPGAVVDQLERGAALTPEERRVTILFVDIRGYTALSEHRRAEEIFSTVNEYTLTVSQIVRAHGGSVVEFSGDGMMVVFGAPEELPEKERAAVRAGRAVLTAVERLPVRGAPLTVGVGIATGLAFVGNIQSADRLIWGAIGNTTNLAARLQGLTRELDAAIVVDAPTLAALPQPERADFVAREQTSIRGRSSAIDVYALPRIP